MSVAAVKLAPGTDTPFNNTVKVVSSPEFEMN
jgi:hypothetical protein